jgi:ATP-binding cassette subfamily C protein LapB
MNPYSHEKPADPVGRNGASKPSALAAAGEHDLGVELRPQRGRPGTPAENCLKPLLQALGWSGELRHLQEAIGGDGTIANFAAFTAVLLRLHYEVLHLDATLNDLPQPQLPCLFIPDSDQADLWVALSKREGGIVEVFKGRAAATATVGPEPQRGRFFYLRKVEEPAGDSIARKTSWFVSLLLREGAAIRGLFLISVCVNLVALAVPIYMIAVFDKAIGTKSLETLAYCFVAIALTMAVEFVLREMRARGLAYLGARMQGALMNGAFQRLLLLPASMTANASVGAQVTRLKLFESVRDVFSGPLAAALLDIPFILIFVFAVFLIGGSLGWIVLAFLAGLTILISVSIPISRRHVAKAGEAKTENRKFLMEFTANIDIITRCGAEEVWLHRYRELSAANIARASAASDLSLIEQTLSQSLVVVTGGFVVGIGAYDVMAGTLSAGALIALMALVWRVLAPIQTTFLNLNKISQVRSIVQQIDQLMRIPPEYQPRKLPTFARTFKGNIELSGVSMRYSPQAAPALRGISLRIAEGSFVALAGSNGSGKSTLLRVLAQLYLPQAGSVFFDGLDYRQFDAKMLREQIGFVQERQTVFTGTIAENIRLAHPSATDGQIVAILEELGAGEVLSNVARGIHEPLVPQHSLLGTEEFLQKINLARAFIKKPPIYLLDDPMFGLGPADQDALKHKLLSLKGKATIILATHRVSYFYLAERLVVLKAGVVTADGMPTDILSGTRQQVPPRPQPPALAAQAGNGHPPTQSLSRRSSS